MWEISGAGGSSSGTPSTVREDSDWLQPRPGGPMGSEHSSRWAALPGQTGTCYSWCSLFLLPVFRVMLCDVIARWPGVMTVCLCVYDPPPSNWRVWYGNALETYLSVPITMEAIQFGLLPVATPAITSQCPPLSPMVRNTHMHTSHVTHSTHLHFKFRSEMSLGLEDRVESSDRQWTPQWWE